MIDSVKQWQALTWVLSMLVIHSFRLLIHRCEFKSHQPPRKFKLNNSKIERWYHQKWWIDYKTAVKPLCFASSLLEVNLLSSHTFTAVRFNCPLSPRTMRMGSNAGLVSHSIINEWMIDMQGPSWCRRPVSECVSLELSPGILLNENIGGVGTR